ncbi:MAG: sulfotransferase family 2 domain-containing protein [Actinomycetota bacterium]
MISHELRCVFVHVPKAAGQSVERAFLDEHGLSWNDRAPLLLRRRVDESEGPPRLAHLTAAEYVRFGHLTRAQWDEYFTFAVVRDPWARVVSMYRHFGEHRRISFDRFVLDELPHRYWHERRWFVRPQVEFLVDDDDELLVDQVIRMEQLDEGFADVARRVGLRSHRIRRSNSSSARPWQLRSVRELQHPIDLVVGSVRQFRNERQQPYRSRSSAAVIDRVGELYERDVVRFGYAPPRSAQRVLGRAAGDRVALHASPSASGS